MFFNLNTLIDHEKPIISSNYIVTKPYGPFQVTILSCSILVFAPFLGRNTIVRVHLVGLRMAVRSTILDQIDSLGVKLHYVLAL